MKLFNKYKKQKKIKIYFICQYKQSCNKTEDVINAMIMDNEIDVKVLAFPYDIKCFPENKELSFWKEKYGEHVINAVNGEEWFDLAAQKPDYVFIQRPYDQYLPQQYSCKELSKFTKICYIPYGYNLANLYYLFSEEHFWKYLYIFFAENEYECNHAKHIFDSFEDDTKRYSLNLGYPVLDSVKKYTDEPVSAFKNISKKSRFNIMWTPRWTTDEKACGTTFFDNKDKIVEYAKQNKNVGLVFRPHPLAFENFIKEGIMKKAEVKQYLKKFENSNMVYDKSSDYYNTFKDTDVLVTDFSSIAIEYIIYNKPLIFCHTDMTILNDFMLELSKVCYCVKDWEEIKQVLDNLRNNKDVLKKKRERFIREKFYLYDGKVKERIINFIKDDFKNNKK